jgi:hypothetical protein
LPIALFILFATNHQLFGSMFSEDERGELMSNARVIPRMKLHGIASRAPVTGDALNGWNGPSTIGLSDRIRPFSLPAKISAGMPLLRLNRVMAFVDANIAVDLCVSTLAAVAGMSPYYFLPLVQAEYGDYSAPLCSPAPDGASEASPGSKVRASSGNCP